MHELTSQSVENEFAIDIFNTLRQIHVSILEFAVLICQLSPEDGNLATSFDGEVNILGRLREVDTVPLKVTCIDKSSGTLYLDHL